MILYYNIKIELNRVLRYSKRLFRFLFLKLNVIDRDSILLHKSSLGFRAILHLSKDVDFRFYLESFENQNFEILKNIIKPDMIIFDIGANIGLYTLFFHSYMNQKRLVFSFEPAPEAYYRLKQNLLLNKKPIDKIYNIGLSDIEGVLKFNICVDDAYNSINNNPMAPVVKVIDIPVTTIDLFCEKYSINNIDILKIDTEGADHQILKGAKKLLTSINPPIILCEYNTVVGVENNNDENLLSFLKELDYEIYEVRKGKLHKLSKINISGSFELFCIKIKHYTLLSKYIIK